MIDLEAIKEKWLNPCGSCDFNMPEYGCNHPAEDHRPVMLDLVREVEQLRPVVEAAKLWRTGNGARSHPERVVLLVALMDAVDAYGDKS